MVYGTGRKYSKGGGKHTYEILKRGGDEYEKMGSMIKTNLYTFNKKKCKSQLLYKEI